MPRAPQRRLNDRCNLYGRKGTPPRSLSHSPAFAFFIDLSLPCGLRSQSSAEIANGVTRGEGNAGGRDSPWGQRALSAVTVTRRDRNQLSDLSVLRLQSRSSYTFREDIDFRSRAPRRGRLVRVTRAKSN